MNDLFKEGNEGKPIKGESRVRPKCAKCRNHGLIVDKKFHKGLCRYESCECPKCRNIDERRAVICKQVRIRRYVEKCEKYNQVVSSDCSQPIPVQRPYSPVETSEYLSTIYYVNQLFQWSDSKASGSTSGSTNDSMVGFDVRPNPMGVQFVKQELD